MIVITIILAVYFVSDIIFNLWAAKKCKERGITWRWLWYNILTFLLWGTYWSKPNKIDEQDSFE